MPQSAYINYEAEARARQSAPCEQHPRGDVRVGDLDQFIVRVNLFYAPLPIEFTREDALALADAIYRLDAKTSPARPEE